jgi:hypothetical protein
MTLTSLNPYFFLFVIFFTLSTEGKSLGEEEIEFEIGGEIRKKLTI